MSAAGLTPEPSARQRTYAAVAAAGWFLQDRDKANLSAGQVVAVREFALARKFGFADYLLFVDGNECGALEAKPEGYSLSGGTAFIFHRLRHGADRDACRNG